LLANKEEQLVLDHRPAQHTAKLVALQPVIS
jgi:hypothetical protein